MRVFLAGVALLIGVGRVWAQAGGGPGFNQPGYNLIEDNGTPLPRRRILNCVPASTCTDDAANNRTTLTATAGGGGAPANAKYLVAACDPTLTAEELLVAGAGLASTEAPGNCGSLDVHTASQEAAFLANGSVADLTCSGAQGAGSAQVKSDGTFQWCDGAATPQRRSVGFQQNVKDFGAKGDNATDDSVAIQAALDAAGPGGTIWLPAGLYRASNLRVQQGQTITGAGLCDITLGTSCGTIIQPLSAAGGQTVFLSKNQAAGCTHGSAGSPKCADGVVFRDLLVEANGNNDIVFDLTNMNETALDHVSVFGRRLSGATGQIGVKIAALNNAGSPTGGLDTKIMASKVFNLDFGVRISFGNATVIGPADHFLSNGVAVQNDGQCTGGGGGCTTGGALNFCTTNADCAGCDATATCSNAALQGGAENEILGSIMELNTTEILDVGGATRIHGNHIENGSGTATGIDMRGRNASITANSFVNNVSAKSIVLTSATAAPVATRVVVRDNDFIGGGPYITEANASTAIDVGRNLYGGGGAKVTTVASSGVVWVDTAEPQTTAALNAFNPTGLANGSLLFATDARNSDPCSTTGAGSAGFIARRQANHWLCDGYVLGVGSGGANRVAVWMDANTLTSFAPFIFDGTQLGIGLSSIADLQALLHVSGTQVGAALFDTYNTGPTGPQIIGRHAQGTKGAESALASGQLLMTLAGRGWTAARCVGGGSDGAVCQINTDCPGGICPSGFPNSSRAKVEGFTTQAWERFAQGADLRLSVGPKGAACVGGTNAGAACTVVDCSIGGTCTAGACVGGPTVGAACCNGGTCTVNAAVEACRVEDDSTLYCGGTLAPPNGGTFRAVLRSPDTVRNLYLDGSSPIVFDGATAAGTTNRTTVNVTDPTGARTLTLADANTVAVQPKDCTSTSQVVGSVSAVDGAIGCVTPPASGYMTVQEEGSNLTQRSTLNFIGPAVTAADDAGNTRTNVTLSQSPGGAGGTSVVDIQRQVLTSGAALSGGGNLSADRTVTLSESPNSASVVGTGRQVLTSGAALSGGGDLSADRTITLSESPNSVSVVGTGRTITGGTCLAGGGDLSADRTLTLATTCSQAETFSGGIDLAASGLSIDVTNDTVTGTTLNKLVKLTLSTGRAIVAATTDVSGVVGIVTAGAGTTGSAQIAREGIASCVFDGATTAGDYVRISPGVAGDCRDDGGSFPTGDGQVLGRVLSTNGGAGTYAMVLYAGELPFSMSPPASVAASPAVVGTGRTLTAGNGLTGTGDLSADRTFDVGAGACITVAADSVAVTNACVTAAALSCTGCVGPTEIASTAVAAGSYGSATQSSTFTVDADGRLTAAANVTISGVNAAVANPTAAVGFTAVNGAATTAMRSDAAPALASVPAGMIRDMVHAQLGGL